MMPNHPDRTAESLYTFSQQGPPKHHLEKGHSVKRVRTQRLLSPRPRLSSVDVLPVDPATLRCLRVRVRPASSSQVLVDTLDAGAFGLSGVFGDGVGSLDCAGFAAARVFLRCARFLMASLVSEGCFFLPEAASFRRRLCCAWASVCADLPASTSTCCWN